VRHAVAQFNRGAMAVRDGLYNGQAQARATFRRPRSPVEACKGAVPVLGCDVVREESTGILYALEANGFGQTWPVLLIVFGLLSLLGRGVRPERPDGRIPGGPQ